MATRQVALYVALAGLAVAGASQAWAQSTGLPSTDETEHTAPSAAPPDAGAAAERTGVAPVATEASPYHTQPDALRPSVTPTGPSAKRDAELQPHPGAVANRSARLHDGFYFRFGLGLGFLRDGIGSRLFDGATLSGVALPGELLLGGTPARGLVIGGGTNGANVFSPTLRINGANVDGPQQLALSLVGAFVDYYPDPAKGLHFEALLGFALLQADNSSSKDSPDGIGGSVGLGNEWWIGDEWSAGLMARITYSRLTYDSNGIDEVHSLWVPAVLGTLTYH